MTAAEIRHHQFRDPFQPFRVRTTAGTVFRVLEPSFMAVTSSEMYVGLDPDETGIPTRSVYLDLNHIVEVEPIKEKLSTPQEPGEGQED